MKIILTLLAGLLIGWVSGQTTTVLFIGNSYTNGNDLPELFRKIAGTNNKNVFVDSYTINGATFQAHSTNAATMNKIKERKWDYVIIQGQSQELSFSDYQVDRNSLPAAVNISDSIYKNHFCTELMMFMTWGRKDGDPQWEPISTYEGMQERLYNGYMRVADSSQASVAPVGVVWREMRNSLPGIELYQDDKSHPTMAGSYLAAASIYTSVFRELPGDGSYKAGLDNSYFVTLKGIMNSSILSDLQRYHLRTRENHTTADFELIQNERTIHVKSLARKYREIRWNFGDGSTSTEQEVEQTYFNDEIYNVKLIAESECNTNENVKIIYIGTAGLENKEAEEKFYIDNTKIVYKGIEKRVYIYTVNGQLIDETGEKEITTEFYPSGIYIVTDGISMLKIHKIR